MSNKKKLIDQAWEAFNYFNDFRLEELKEDDVYYIKALMDYIIKLETDLLELSKKQTT